MPEGKGGWGSLPVKSLRPAMLRTRAMETIQQLRGGLVGCWSRDFSGRE